MSNLTEIDQTAQPGGDVTDDDGDEDGDDGQEAAEQHGAKDHHGEGQHGDANHLAIKHLGGQAGHVGGNRCQLQTDDRDNGAHRRRREYHVDPLVAKQFDQAGNSHEQQA